MWKRSKYELLLLGTVVVWGLNFPVIKAALAVMHPHVVNAFRFSVSIIVLGSLYWYQERRAGRGVFAPYRFKAVQIVTLGLFGFVVYQLCFIIGVNNTSAGTAALIMASAPVWTAVTSRILGLEHLRAGAWIGLLITFAGTIAIILTGGKDVSLGSTALFGNVLILAASICWGTYTALSRPMLQHATPSGLAFLGLLPALPVLFAIAAPYGLTVDWYSVSPLIWIAIIFSGALSSGLAFVTWSLAVKNLGSSHTAAFGNLVPVVALVFGYYLLGEAVTLGQIAGGSVVLLGLYVMRTARQAERQLADAGPALEPGSFEP
jgi:drug/metabolite transporter (DMT)-like permease